jgi:Ser/Thr protein kinase RdoA (MazF antagonist)
LEFGLLWSNTEQSYYLIDLALTCLMNIDQMKEIINAYEEMIQLTDDEMNFLDTFIRLQLVLMISHNDIDDEKQLDLLEQLSSNIFFVRNIVR